MSVQQEPETALVIPSRNPQPSTDYREKPELLMPTPEKNVRWMLYLTGIGCFRMRFHKERNNCDAPNEILVRESSVENTSIRSDHCILKWPVPILCNLWIGGACFVMLWYPSYYINQASVWTTDMALIWIVHSYLLFLQSKWDVSSCFELNEISKLKNIITIIFYTLFLIYWLYFAYIMFNLHNENNILIQLGNTYMSIAWFLFFTNSAALYYFICTKLFQRAESVRKWLTDLSTNKPQLEEFYNQYNYHCKKIRRFGAHWNFIVFLGFILLTFHVPIDLISIIYEKNYYDIPGAVIKGFALAWYLYSMCSLDDLEERVISTLYKNRIYSLDDLQMIERYVSYRGLGLDFYGIRINTGYIMKIVLLVSNFVLPTLYAVLKGFVIKE